MKIDELLNKRAKCIEDARSVLEAAEKENRSMTAEEEVRFDKFHEEADGLWKQAEQERRQRALEAGLNDLVHGPLKPEGTQSAESETMNTETRAFQKYLVKGPEALEGAERRALQVDSDTGGGYLLSKEISDRLIQAVDNLVFVRQYAEVQQVTSSDSLGIPSLDTDPADPAWTSEIGAPSEDSSMAFGGRELHPHPLAKLIKVSQKMLRKVPSAENLVLDRLAYKFGTTEENVFLNGSGSNQPLGVFTASSLGISTGRDVSTGNTTSSITFDGLKEAKYTLKPAYWAQGTRWLFHRDAVKQIDKLKDGEGQYIWKASVQEGEPDRLLNWPVDMSEYAPNTFTTGLYVGILAYWPRYTIVDALTMTVQRLVELYAGTNQIGFIGRAELDGMPILEEAFVRVKLA